MRICDSNFFAGDTNEKTGLRLLFRLNACSPFLLREAGLVVSDSSSVVVLTQGPLAPKPFEANTSLDAIMAAFQAAQLPALQTVPHEALRPQDGTIRIVIGSRL